MDAMLILKLSSFILITVVTSQSQNKISTISGISPTTAATSTNKTTLGGTGITDVPSHQFPYPALKTLKNINAESGSPFNYYRPFPVTNSPLGSSISNPVYGTNSAFFNIDGDKSKIDSSIPNTNSIRSLPVFSLDSPGFNFDSSISQKSQTYGDGSPTVKRNTFLTSEPIIEMNPSFLRKSNKLDRFNIGSSRAKIPNIENTFFMKPQFEFLSKDNHNTFPIIPRFDFTSSFPKSITGPATTLQKNKNSLSASTLDQTSIKGSYNDPVSESKSPVTSIEPLIPKFQRSFEEEYPPIGNQYQNFLTNTAGIEPLQLTSESTVRHIPYQIPKPSQHFLNNPQSVTSFPSSDLPSGEYSSESLVDDNYKTLTPLPIVDLENIQQFPGFLRALETQPILLPTAGNNLNLTSHLTQLYNPGIPNGNQPFLTNPKSQHRAQIVPVLSPGSTAQFPQYKGASIQVQPGVDYKRQYQSLVDQPRLQFNVNEARELNKPQTSERPYDRVNKDVEVIEKEKPEFESQDASSIEENREDLGNDNDDDEFDTAYENLKHEYGPQSEQKDESKFYNRENTDDSSENYFEEQSFKQVSSAEDDEGSSRESYFTNPLGSEYNRESSRLEEKPRYEVQEDNVSRDSYDISPQKSYIRQYDEKPKRPFVKESLQLRYAPVTQIPESEESLSEDDADIPEYENAKKQKLDSDSRESTESTERSVGVKRRKPLKRLYSDNDGAKETKLNVKKRSKVVHQESFGDRIPRKEVSTGPPKVEKKCPNRDSHSHSISRQYQ